MAPISLSQVFFRKLSVPFLLIALLLVLLTAALDAYLRNQKLAEDLAQRVVQLNDVMASYLERSEFEARFIAQQIVAGTPSTGTELETIFENHDVLLFGGLDFFVVQMSDGRELIDPRARLYTDDDLALQQESARYGYWVRVASSQGVDMLVYKQPLPNLPSASAQPRGALFGFIVLSQNLTLASELLDTAGVDRIRLLDQADEVLMETSGSAFDPAESSIEVLRPLIVGNLDEAMQIEFALHRPVAEAFTEFAWWRFVTIFVTLLILFGITIKVVQRYVFTEVNKLLTQVGGHENAYQEFKPLLSQLHQYQLRMRSQEQLFELLMNSLQVAVVFCDEGAKITRVNKQAEAVLRPLTPGVKIFDVTPIDCHRFYRKAMHGESGVSVELQMPGVERVVRWYFISFVNEYAFRNVVMLGYDVTEANRLQWQLEQMYPAKSLVRPYPNVDVLMSEFHSVAYDPSYTVTRNSVAWFSTLAELIDELARVPESEPRYRPLGQLLTEAYHKVDRLLPLGEPSTQFDYQFSLEDACAKVSWQKDHLNLIALAIMASLASNLSGRGIEISLVAGRLQVLVVGIDAHRPLLLWLLEALCRVLTGSYAIGNDGHIELGVALAKDGQETLAALDGKQVVFISNDYKYTDTCVRSLSQLGVTVHTYGSFTQFAKSHLNLGQRYHGLLIGADSNLAFLDVVKQLEALDPALQGKAICLGGDSELDGYLHIKHYPSAYVLGSQLVGLPEQHWLNLEHLQDATLGQWFIIGGGDVLQAIWQAELGRFEVSSRIGISAHDLETLLNTGVARKVLVLSDEAYDLLGELIHNTKDNVTWVLVSERQPMAGVRAISNVTFPLSRATFTLFLENS